MAARRYSFGGARVSMCTRSGRKMAIYTELSADELGEIARAFSLGPVSAYRFLPEGSINTNVVLTTERGRYVVRHTTVRTEDDLRFEAELLSHLSLAHFPAPVMLRAGSEPFVALAGGRACVFGYLVGEELSRARFTEEHALRLGAELARLHRAAMSFGGHRENPYGSTCVEGWLAGLLRHADAEVARAAHELSEIRGRAPALERGLLPQGIVHADLFIDNVKWLGDRVAAFFDFEMACRDAFVLDLAITLNAWCFDQGSYLASRCRALVAGYQSERPLTAQERSALHSYAVFGAVRYAASRIRDFHLSPLPPEKLFRKDFRTYWARARSLDAMGQEGFAALCAL